MIGTSKCLTSKKLLQILFAGVNTPSSHLDVLSGWQGGNPCPVSNTVDTSMYPQSDRRNERKLYRPTRWSLEISNVGQIHIVIEYRMTTPGGVVFKMRDTRTR